ncbi:MAG: NADH:flavin oxidoreductase [Pseudomonadota bacterium]
MAFYDALLAPFTLKGLTLKNRIVSTSHGPAYAEGAMPGARYQRYHEEKAKGGLAMTMFGGSSNVSIDSPSLFGQLYLGDDAVVPYLKDFSARIHGHGCALMCQITHMGHRTVWDQGHWLAPVSASNVRDKAHRAFPKAMEPWDIERVIGDYGRAARRCRDGGLDGIEVALTGHLPNQFLTPAMNRREDAYGGSLENRMRFLMEVLEEIRRQVGGEFIVGLRFPLDERLEGGLGPEDCIALAQRLEASGAVDFLSLYGGSPAWNPGFEAHIPTMAQPLAPWLETVKPLRAAVGLPLIHATRIIDVTTAAQAIKDDALDLVGMTRAHMADPYLVAKLKRGEEERIRPCVGAGYCIDRIYRGGEALCLHNPATGREQTMAQTIAPSTGPRRRVVVVGGGPGGLEAARVSAARGHVVILFEAAGELGGQVAIAARAGWRRDLIGIVRWLAQEVELAGVELRLNHYAEASDVLAERPDVVIVATGGLPDLDGLAGAEHAASVWDVLTGQVEVKPRVVIFDQRGDHQALSCAEFMAERGAQVELVTPDRAMGEELGISNYDVHCREFARLGISVTPNSRLLAVESDQSQLQVCLCHDYGGQEATRTVDQVVLEQGVVPLDQVYHDLAAGARNGGEIDLEALAGGALRTPIRNPDGAYELFRVGDAVACRNIHAALYDSLRICQAL